MHYYSKRNRLLLFAPCDPRIGFIIRSILNQIRHATRCQKNQLTQNFPLALFVKKCFFAAISFAPGMSI
jgi:hypothetical protein